MIDDALFYLKQCGSLPDEDIDLGVVALAVVMPDHVGVSFDRYHNHLKKITALVSERHAALLSGGAVDSVGTRLAALKYVLSDTYDYRGDGDSHEVIESADMMRVIDRAKGCSAALCILYMDAALKQGWVIEGLAFPQHFYCRLECGGERLIFDPSAQCKVMAAHDLRASVKQALGQGAELSTDYLEGFGARAMVVHLYNKIKLRRVEMGEYELALDMIVRLRTLAPNEYRLLLDAGVLYARTGQVQDAIECLNSYIQSAPDYYDRQEAMVLLQDLRNA